jgi:hypothetical protein
LKGFLVYYQLQINICDMGDGMGGGTGGDIPCDKHDDMGDDNICDVQVARFALQCFELW